MALVQLASDLIAWLQMLALYGHPAPPLRVALQLAIRHESLVSKLVSTLATFRKDDWYPSVFEAIGDSRSHFRRTRSLVIGARTVGRRSAIGA